MKKQKKFGRKLKLNKETITVLNGSITDKVVAGKPILTLPDTICCIPCHLTIPTEVICTEYDCYTIHIC